MTKIGRNDPCPCGSGRKYKKCCLGKFEFPETKKHQNELEKETTRVPVADKFADEIDEKMQKGYDLLEGDKPEAACELWLEVWEDIKSLLGQEVKSVEAADNSFNGIQFLSNWVQDLEMELANASIGPQGNRDWLRDRIQYCREFCKIWPESSEDLIKNMKRSEAESYFGLGQIQDGETAFERLIEQYPNWIWGYIGWGDMYGVFRWNGQVPMDKDKARKLYEKALTYKENADVAEERLEELEKL